MNANSVSDAEIITYYDTCQIDYRLVWHLDSQKSLHYGYWDKNTTSLKIALQNMNDLVGETAQINPGDRILDAGCGIGGTAVYFCQKYPCSVEGISLSKKQVELARELAVQFNVGSNAAFSVQDYCRTDFEDESFDVIVAIESVCHANDKEKFLKEAFRLLKQGGRLIVTDFFRNQPKYEGNNEELILKWANTWAVPDFEYYTHFKEKTYSAGFELVNHQNISSQIFPSARRLYQYFYPGLIVHSFMRIIGLRNKTHQANVWSTYYQYKALKKNLWSYHIFKSVK